MHVYQILPISPEMCAVHLQLNAKSRQIPMYKSLRDKFLFLDPVPAIALVFLLLALLAGCANPAVRNYTTNKNAEGREAMVVSGHPLASEAGLEVLGNGGNAIDASIAVQFALAVVYPRAGNIGGGGFLVYHAANGETATLDYREKAPAAAHSEMYLDSNGVIIPRLSLDGHLAAGVPGTVAGLYECHLRYGRLPWSDLVKPAIRLARRGFEVTANEAKRLNTYAGPIGKYNDPSIPFIREDDWQTGDVLRQPDLARTLARISAKGKDGFYSGTTADLIVAEMESGGGVITREDLRGYKPVWREPVISDYRGYEIIGMPPPSSGGIAVAQLLEFVEPFPLREWGPDNLNTIHLMAEAGRRAFADRAEYLGDPDYVEVPSDSLLSPDYLVMRMSDFNPDSVSPSKSITKQPFSVPMESYETTHLTVVDSDGNAVSATTTLNSNYGCKVVVDGAGFFLNNEMDDFSAKPGVPNQFGLLGNEANAIEPGKRMLSSMAPTIVLSDSKFYFTVGTPGGSTIITSVFQIILDIIDFDMRPAEAVARGRFHHQWYPDEIRYEASMFTPEILPELVRKGHHLHEVSSIGLVEVIMRDSTELLIGAADPRGDDSAAGY